MISVDSRNQYPISMVSLDSSRDMSSGSRRGMIRGENGHQQKEWILENVYQMEYTAKGYQMDQYTAKGIKMYRRGYSNGPIYCNRNEHR